MNLKTKYLRLLHLVLTCLWVALIIPTLWWWKESVLWVALMSLWANIASHAAAWQAAKAEEAVENDKSK